MAGALQIQFADGIISEHTTSFVPKFTTLAGDTTLAYIEMADIIGLL
jgi:hypothetical protein